MFIVFELPRFPKLDTRFVINEDRAIYNKKIGRVELNFVLLGDC